MAGYKKKDKRHTFRMVSFISSSNTPNRIQTTIASVSAIPLTIKQIEQPFPPEQPMFIVTEFYNHLINFLAQRKHKYIYVPAMKVQMKSQVARCADVLSSYVIS